MKNKTILVLGGAGAVGSQLVNKISKICKKVVVLDNLSSGFTCLLEQRKNIMFIKGDIRSDEDLRKCFLEKPDIAFHMAAFFANQKSVEYPQEDLSVNGMGTLKFYEYCALYGKLERIIYASSRAVYGSQTPPFVEDSIDALNLTTPYQITKMLGESYANYFVKYHNLPICCARFFNSFGPGEIPGQYRNVIPNFIYWALNKKSLPITGTGKETRDFTSVNDITDGLILMAEKRGVVGEAFNLAAGREIEIEYLAKLINKKTKNDAPLVYLPNRKWDLKKNLSASNEKAKKLLGFKPDLGFEKNIEEAIEWFKCNKKMIEERVDFPMQNNRGEQHND